MMLVGVPYGVSKVTGAVVCDTALDQMTASFTTSLHVLFTWCCSVAFFSLCLPQNVSESARL